MRIRFFSILSIITLSITSCGMRTFFQTWGDGSLKTVGHSVQVGAFEDMRLAVSLEKKLKYWGVDAFHFRHADGLYKVRFGDYKTYNEAKKEALRIRKEGLIGGFFIIRPESFPIARLKKNQKRIPTQKRTIQNHKQSLKNNDYLLSNIRKDLIKTARRFLGIPYRWGGTSADNGFDCSGLTLTVYRLNGFQLPRSAALQMRSGKRIPKKQLKPGDLVFFDTAGRGTISHVGIYHGNGTFIHAPRRGKSVEITRLDRGYFKKKYRGGCRYF